MAFVPPPPRFDRATWLSLLAVSAAAFFVYVYHYDFATKIYQIPAATPNTVTHIVNVSVPGSTSNGFTVPSLKRVIVADAFENQVLIFKYPHGGTAVNAITTGLNMPWDALVSKP